MNQAALRTQLPENFYLYHGLLPALLLAFVLALVNRLQVDETLASMIFNSHAPNWQLRNSFLLEDIIHKGGRQFTALLFLTALALCFLPAGRTYRQPLKYLTLSVFVSIITINLLKKFSGIPCPWSVAAFGGSQHMIEWFNGFNGESGCFPAGHASAGYAWVALYFVALMLRPASKYPALFFGLTLGIIYGVAQQLRGAHFLSHDIWTLAICWFVPMLLYPRFCVFADSGAATTTDGDTKWN